jgi:uncharacterized protein YprB with RNaseH-like and TPR domain
MITSTFRHIAGLGPMRERQLWARGVTGWSALPDGEVLSPRLDGRLREGVRQSLERFQAGDLDHFAARLPQTEHWRLLPHLLEGAAFVDVEVGSRPDDLAVVGVLDAQGVRAFVGGRDLDAFPERAARWTCLVTFNGAAFDVPALRRAFPGWAPPAAHVDLRHCFARLREPGGLKQLEARLGLFRPPHLSGLDGQGAVALWEAQQRGDGAALRRLVEYNLYDVFHLKPLAELAYNRLVRRTGMPARELAVTERGALLYDVSRALEAACRA